MDKFIGEAAKMKVNGRQKETVRKFSDRVKVPWTKQEDRLLQRLVANHGEKWTEISQYVSGRDGRQCRERYNNYLRPNIKSTKEEPWTEEEDGVAGTRSSKIWSRSMGKDYVNLPARKI
ncbi:unnamed protein product [Rhodiola kirilowii]